MFLFVIVPLKRLSSKTYGCAIVPSGATMRLLFFLRELKREKKKKTKEKGKREKREEKREMRNEKRETRNEKREKAKNRVYREYHSTV